MAKAELDAPGETHLTAEQRDTINVEGFAKFGFRWPPGLQLEDSGIGKLIRFYTKRTRYTPRLQEARSILADHGIRYLELEFITDWFAEGDRRRASDFVRRGLLDGAAQLGVNHVKVGGDFGGAAWPMDHMVEEFSRL